VAAAGISMVRSLCTSSSQWSKWMKQRYLKGKKHLTEAGCNRLDSGTWKWVINSRNTALQWIVRKLDNGQDTSIWYDSWTPIGKLIDQIDTYPITSSKWVVSDIVEDGNWSLKYSELNAVWGFISLQRVPDSLSSSSDN